MLGNVRVLDLTDEKGLLAGRLLGDIGADVIKVEAPGGDPARNIGPFYHDITDPEKSLFWFAYNFNKRGITLDIRNSTGQELLKRLVRTADVLVESFMPGYLDELRLGYQALSQINPRLIMTSISPFGQQGPYKNYKGTSIVCWALGGYLYESGDPDRPPVQISHHFQAYLHGAADAAVGTVMALYDREITGEGQHVDVSIQQSVEWCTYFSSILWQFEGRNYVRQGSKFGAAPDAPTLQTVWPCKDGYIRFSIFSGQMGMVDNPQLVKWMDSEGMATDLWKSIDWANFDWRGKSQEMADEMQASLAKFFMKYTKSELYGEALKRGIMLYPVATPKDMLESVQLGAREYWVEVEHPELDCTITYPGAFIKASETPCEIRRRAPLIGEHNEDIYENELGLTRQELSILKESGVV